MFRDVYKKAMDDVGATDGLLEKILSEKQTEPKRNFKTVTAYATLTAAVIVVAMAAAVYPGLSDLYKERRAADMAEIEYIDKETKQKTAAVEISDTADLYEDKSNELTSKYDEVQYGEDETQKQNRNMGAGASDAAASARASGAAEEISGEVFSEIADADDTAAPEYDKNIVAENCYEDEIENDFELAEESSQTDDASSSDGAGAASFASGGDSPAPASGGSSAKNVISDEFDYSSVFHENAQTSGFSNVGGKAVCDSETALLLAKNEVGADGDVYVSRDETVGVWRVCFYTETEIVYVYIDDSGSTLMIVHENI